MDSEDPADGTEPPSTVRVRGIYATALTELFGAEESFDVVQPSTPIRERFERSFAGDRTIADATVWTTQDRQGLEIAGAETAVETIRERLRAVGRDTFAWAATMPKSAVFRGRITETLGGGAVVDLGAAGEGYLPYDRIEDYAEEGDELRVQVARAEPPWSDDRPSLATDLRIPGGLLELHRGTAGTRSETARLVDLLPVDPPEGWEPSLSPAADDADLDTLAAALEVAGDRAGTLMEAIAAADDEIGLVAAPLSGTWVWFGRESRFALDERRRDVTTTMAGHHRIKAATDAASAAVDFAEAVCDPGGGFPFAVTTQQFGPTTDDSVAIGHGKPDGRRIVLGRGEVTEWDADGSITIERTMTGGGTYDALDVDRESGDTATTTFVEGRWWYATVYRGSDGTRRGTYVNVCTPVEIFPREVRYVDLHVDVVKGPDGDVRRVDDDELDAAVDAGHVSEALAERAREVAASIERAL
ncbi:MAG: DUF402 domain-containing protein [Natronomonas sp.]